MLSLALKSFPLSVLGTRLLNVEAVPSFYDSIMQNAVQFGDCKLLSCNHLVIQDDSSKMGRRVRFHEGPS